MTYHPKSEFLHQIKARGFLADCTDLQDLDARHNFWGSVEEKRIERQLYDRKDVSYLGRVIYHPPEPEAFPLEAVWRSRQSRSEEYRGVLQGGTGAGGPRTVE